MPVDGLKTRGDLDRFARKNGRSGARGTRGGEVTVTYPGSQAESGWETVTHGLPRTPSSVVGTPSGGDHDLVLVQTRNKGASTFEIRAVNPSTSPSNGDTSVIDWQAVA